MSKNILEELRPFFMSNQSIAFVYNRDMREPEYNENIPTACVGFDNEGNNIAFYMNKDFMENLSYDEKCFIFSHEALHVLFDHGKRGEDFLNSLPKNQGKRSRKLLNYAMDLCINHILAEQYFPIVYSIMDLPNHLVTFDNIEKQYKFPEPIPRDRDFIYYYNLLLEHMFSDEEKKKMQFSENGEDGFDFDGDFETFGDAVNNSKTSSGEKKVKKEIHDGNGSETETNHNKGKKHTTNANHSVKEVVTTYKKMNIQDAITRYVKNRNMSAIDFNRAPDVKYDWNKVNRRTIYVVKKDTSVPKRDVKYSHKKHRVLIYCDVSGSVESYTKKFINMVNYIDKEKCEILFHVWADSVSEVYYNDKGIAKWKDCGGGTNIQNVISHYKENFSDKKIDCVIVLTDGQYDDIKKAKKAVKDPTKWVFFMTEQDEASKNVFNKSTSVTIDW